MANVSGTFIALAFYLVPLGAMLGAVWIARRVYRRADRRHPLTRDLLRGPGHTLGRELEDARGDLVSYLVSIVPVPLFLLAAWALDDRLRGRQSAFPVIYLAVIGILVIFLVYRAFPLVRKIRRLSLGQEAESAVGQELNQLLGHGFHVFHDIRGDTAFNVDHVVVGPTGVFAVETKGRTKPLREGKAEYRVEQHGDRLIFPGWTETKPLQQAQRNAEWLAKWLSSSTGEAVQVQPVLALPGWFIERRDRCPVLVISPTNCQATFSKWRASSLSTSSIQRITHQLDARCRDVVPRKA
jgi:Nuclease-related domain